jgi:hypothetical protein
MKRLLLLASCAVASCLPGASSTSAQGTEPDRQGTAFFEQKIRPVLVDRCYPCHADKARGGLRLDSRANLLRGGDSGPAIVPGKPRDSLLLKAIGYEHPDLKMPPKGRLPTAVVADFEKWIQMGAPDPRDGKAAAGIKVDLEKARRHWAFRPLGNPEPPPVKDRAWVRSPLDAFIQRKLEEKGIAPAPEADPLTWLRRVYLDLTGLPPTPEEQRGFLKDLSPRSFERVVDDLLARPHYGERWGRHWLDVARYAESKGYESDGARPFAWRYRDWVIEAFNRDLPYDRFLTEQLAGDQLPDPDARGQIATGFLVLGPFDTIAADGKQARYDALDDVVATTSSAFLGLTLACCRCHDHKFEPLAQQDYYRLLAAFDTMKVDAQIPVGSPAELQAARKANEAVDAELALLLDDLARLAVPLLEKAEQQGGIQGKKGRLDAKQLGSLLRTIRSATSPQPGQKSKGKPADVLTREFPRIEAALKMMAGPEGLQRLKEIGAQAKTLAGRRPQPLLAPAYSESKSSSGRTRLLVRGEPGRPGAEVAFALPEILAPPGETPPAQGRRLWLAQWMTGPGRGLTARVIANRIWQYHFGQGFLLDANDMGVHGGAPSHPELLEWLARDLVAGGWKLKRLHRQIVLSSTYRQSAAHPRAAQDPDNHLFGRWPTHRLEAEAIRDSMLAVSGTLSRQQGGPSINRADAPRRSVYLTVKRNAPLAELSLLGFPDSSSSCGRRTVPTTPVQSLLLLNGKFANTQARAFAERVRKEAGGDEAAQVRRAFELALCRPPRAEELKLALAFLAAPGRAAPGQEPLAAFCLVLFNTNEFVYAN